MSSLPNSPKRQSGIELARIVSMALVLMSHVGFYSVGMPKINDFEAQPLSASTVIVYESFTYVCVNVFILISGWFGIHFRGGRLLSLIFQVLFISALTRAILVATGYATIPIRLELVEFLTMHCYWFVPAYILLYVLSPVLNAFVENRSRIEVRRFLLLFYVLQSVYGWLLKDDCFHYGYSTLSFIGLYLLARYIHLYKPYWSKMRKRKDFALYVLFSMMTAVFSILQIYSRHGDGWWTFMYLSPLVVLASVFLFLFFAKIKLQNNKINILASSVFAVYLVNCEPSSFNAFTSCIAKWNQANGMLLFAAKTALLLVFVFCVSLILDRVRLLLWNFISVKSKNV